MPQNEIAKGRNFQKIFKLHFVSKFFKLHTYLGAHGLKIKNKVFFLVSKNKIK